MQNLSFRILYLGDMTFYKKELILTPDDQETVVSPAFAILIKHPTAGYLLYDTGNHPQWEITYNEPMKARYPITHLTRVSDALQELGLSVHHISTLMLSHLHFDHTGGLYEFCGTRAGSHVIVSQTELDTAMEKMHEPGSPYIPALFHNLEGISFSTVQGTYEVAPGVTLFPQNCHTPGLMGLELELENHGTIIFTSDSVYTADSDRKQLPPGGTINKTDDEFHTNLAALRLRCQQKNATLFYGHDIDQVNQWLKKGWCD